MVQHDARQNPRHLARRRRRSRRGGGRVIAALVLVAACVALGGLCLRYLTMGTGGDEAAPALATASGTGSQETVAEASQDGDDQVGEDSTEAADTSSGRAQRVREGVEPLTEGLQDEVSVAYVSLRDTSDAWYGDADRQVRSASMIKLVILAEYLREVDAGALVGEEAYTLRASDIVGGTGSLQGRGAGYTCTFDELAGLMISQSDNVAANVLIDRLGMDAINAEASALGLTSTRLERKMMDTAAIASGLDNYTSARDIARVLVLVGQGELVSPDASAKALGWLERQIDRAGIPAGLPAQVTCGNKTGSLDSARHDGAIVLADDPYVLVVMTEGLGSGAADALIAQVSSAVWQLQ